MSSGCTAMPPHGIATQHMHAAWHAGRHPPDSCARAAQCRQRTAFLQQAGLDAGALPPFFRRLQRVAEQLGLGSYVGRAGAGRGRIVRAGEPAPAGSGGGLDSGGGPALGGGQRSKAS